jgi:hypothetical protein
MSRCQSILFLTLLLDCAVTKLLSSSNQGILYGRGTWHARERKGTVAGFWLENPKERGNLEDLNVG